jgi:seryl-tRNA synthetase
VWLPAQNTYREISSVSNAKPSKRVACKPASECARQKRAGAHLEQLGSGRGPHAGGGAENYQRKADGSVTVPVPFPHAVALPC